MMRNRWCPFAFLAMCCLAGFAAGGGCFTLPDPNSMPDPNTSDPNDPNTGDPNSGQGAPKVAQWSKLFDASQAGALSSVWGTGPDDIFVVGGVPAQGEVYHYDGTGWQEMAVPTGVGLLVWCYGFAPDNVFCVGVSGSVVHYDGSTWTRLDPGTNDDLWGIWGASPEQMWIVGEGRDTPTLIRFDGVNGTFTRLDVPENDRGARALFKVWGIGSKVFAVGGRGLIIEYDGSAWRQVPAGAEADDDFVSLWGTSEDNIVAVGGRSSAQVATYDGSAWTTISPDGVPGLNAVFMDSPDQAVIGGINGFVGIFDGTSNTILAEESGEAEAVHAMWGDGTGRYFGVGGRFSAPYTGLAVVRTFGEPGFSPTLPAPPPEDPNEPAIEDCNGDGIDDAVQIDGHDCDGNGVLDDCDPDADGDRVPDACDACADANDALDADKDGVADGCDTCPGGDDAADADGDGVPDACDVCPGGDDTLDADGDGVPNACDICPDGDDTRDNDGDGTPNACDGCPNSDIKVDPGECGCSVADVDSDGDGVPDCIDGCDETIDSDGDGTPDCFDGCPDDPGKVESGACGCGVADTDSDGDGTPDCDDPCPDDGDSDGDGVDDCADPCPDDELDSCLCDTQTDCDLGENCVDGTCQPVDGTDLELGVWGPGTQGCFFELDPPYEKLEEGGEYAICCGFQGFTDAYLSLRATGFRENVRVDMRRSMTRLSDGVEIVPETTLPLTMSYDAALDANVFYGHYMFLFGAPEEFDGEDVIVDVTITDRDNDSVSASLSLTVTLATEGTFCD